VVEGSVWGTKEKAARGLDSDNDVGSRVSVERRAEQGGDGEVDGKRSSAVETTKKMAANHRRDFSMRKVAAQVTEETR
jgi:hypothetical protein